MAVERMLAEGKRQWTESYPTADHVRADIERSVGYVLEDDGRVTAYGAVVFDGEPAYDDLAGEWLTDEPYVVVHRLAVAQYAQGRGVGGLFLEAAGNLARERGVGSFRIDTNFDNFAMLHLLDKLGFAYCGEVRYEGGSRKAFEKEL